MPVSPVQGKIGEIFKTFAQFKCRSLSFALLTTAAWCGCCLQRWTGLGVLPLNGDSDTTSLFYQLTFNLAARWQPRPVRGNGITEPLGRMRCTCCVVWARWQPGGELTYSPEEEQNLLFPRSGKLHICKKCRFIFFFHLFFKSTPFQQLVKAYQNYFFPSKKFSSCINRFCSLSFWNELLVIRLVHCLFFLLAFYFLAHSSAGKCKKSGAWSDGHLA